MSTARAIHRSIAADVLVFSALLISCACWAAFAPAVIDIAVADEALYLKQGMRLTIDGLPSPQWAPLYSLWYFALSLVQSDPIGLYYLSYTALTVAVPLLLYVHLRQSRVSAALAGAVAGLYLWSATNIDVWPYPSRFACLLLLGALIVAASRRFVRHAGLVLVVALFLLSYVRPEYFVSWAIAALVVGVARLRDAWRDPQSRGVRVAAPLAACAIAFAAWMAVFGVPLAGGDRAERAFAQHVARTHADTMGTGLSANTEYGWVMRGVFDGARSASEALMRNPAMFAQHVAENASHLPARLAEIALLQPSERLISRERGQLVAVAIGIVVLGAFIGLLAITRKDRASVLRRAADDSTLRLQMLALVAIACAVVPAALVIYPRPHYLQVLGLLLTVLATRAIAAWVPRPSGIRTAVVSALLLLISTAAAASTLRSKAFVFPYRDTVNFLRGLRHDSEIRALAPTVASASFNAYLDPSVVMIPLTPRSGRRGGLADFLERERVDLIVWPGQFERFPTYRDDPMYRGLMTSPQEHGFVGLEIPNGRGLYVLVRIDSSLWTLNAPPPTPPAPDTPARSAP